MGLVRPAGLSLKETSLTRLGVGITPPFGLFYGLFRHPFGRKILLRVLFPLPIERMNGRLARGLGSGATRRRHQQTTEEHVCK
jgi:hypothetical protein